MESLSMWWRLFLEAAAAVRAREERVALYGRLSADALHILRTFARAAPILAVRQRSSERITQGLQAVAIL